MLGVVSENMGGNWSSYWEDTPTTHSFDNKQVYSKGYCRVTVSLYFVHVVTNY